VSFLSPLFLIGAAAAAIPILLHLLKREPEARVKFSAIKLLKHAPVEHTQRRRLRELLLLALRVTALVLLALAFARPFLASSRADQPAGVTIVALDTSLSLSAPGQLEKAKTLAREAIAAAPASDLVGVVTFSNNARIAREPSGDRSLAVTAVNDAVTTFGATRYRTALSRASAAIEGRRGTIVVVTDLQEGGWDAGDRATVPASTEVRVADVGAPPPNLAVTSARAAGDRVLATIRNAGPAAREVRVRLMVDGRIAGEATAAMAPGQSSEVALPGARGVEASVTIEDPSGVQADNVRYLVLNNQIRPLVLVLTASSDSAREGLYVRHALMAEGAGGAVYDVEQPGGVALGTWDGPRMAREAAVIVLSTRGLDRHGRQLLTDYVKQGGGLLIAAGPDIDRDVAAEISGGAMALEAQALGREQPGSRSFVPVDARHPVFDAFGSLRTSLGLVTFSRIAIVSAPSCETLATFTSGETALVECPANDGRVLVFASDLNNAWNDFPRRPTFVPFLHEMVRYLAGARPNAGDYVVGAAPAGVNDKPGIAVVRASGVPDRRVSVNVDPLESNPARLTSGEFLAAVTRLQDTARVEGRLEDQQQEERQRLWRWALGVMLALLLIESVVAMKTA
jgi:Aerotolerance regulator N-terminal/von Willebrand factor type A domain